MSERMTSIYLPGVFGAGFAEYGRKTAPEMIALLRKHAMQDKADAEAVLAAPDAAFTVSTYVGVHVRRQRETLQEGRKAAPQEASAERDSAQRTITRSLP